MLSRFTYCPIKCTKSSNFIGMKRRKWTVSEKLSIIKLADAEGVVETCRKHSVSSGTYYSWKKKFETKGIDGLKNSYSRDSKELKTAQEEIRILRKLLTDREIELELQKELLKKKFGTSDPRKI